MALWDYKRGYQELCTFCDKVATTKDSYGNAVCRYHTKEQEKLLNRFIKQKSR